MKLNAAEFGPYEIRAAHLAWKEAEAQASRREKEILAMRKSGREPSQQELDEVHRLRHAADVKLQEVANRMRSACVGHA